MNEKQWGMVQDETGTDIMSIVADLHHGRKTWTETAQAISDHCNAAYRQGKQDGQS